MNQIEKLADHDNKTSPKSSSSTSASTIGLDSLNEYCLIELYKHLKHFEIVHLGEVNSSLQVFTANFIYKRNFKRDFRNCNYVQIPKQLFLFTLEQYGYLCETFTLSSDLCVGDEEPYLRGVLDRCPNLRSLELRHFNCPQQIIPATSTQFKSLSIINCTEPECSAMLTDSLAETLLRSWSTVDEIKLERHHLITASILHGYTALRSISFVCCPLLRVADLFPIYLKNYSSNTLRELEIRQCIGIETDTLIMFIADNMPLIERLTIELNSEIPNLVRLGELANLERLDLYDSMDNIFVDLKIVLKRLPKLRELYLESDSTKYNGYHLVQLVRSSRTLEQLHVRFIVELCYTLREMIKMLGNEIVTDDDDGSWQRPFLNIVTHFTGDLTVSFHHQKIYIYNLLNVLFTFVYTYRG